MSTTGRRRGRRYPVQMSISLTTDMHEAINAAADKYEITAAHVCRESIRRGLPGTLSSLKLDAAKRRWRSRVK